MEVEFSDKPELSQLTVNHLQGPLGLHALILALATFVWLAELCLTAIKNRMNLVTEITYTP